MVVNTKGGQGINPPPTKDNNMTVKIELAAAPAFIAGLVKEGLTFEAHQQDDYIVVTLTGGY